MRLSVASLRRMLKGTLHVEFVHQALTSYGGLELLRRHGWPLLSAALTACVLLWGSIYATTSSERPAASSHLRSPPMHRRSFECPGTLDEPVKVRQALAELAAA